MSQRAERKRDEVSNHIFERIVMKAKLIRRKKSIIIKRRNCLIIMNPSKNQQEWSYNIIGIFIFLLGIGWLIIFWDSPISLKIGTTTIYLSIWPLGPLFSLFGYLFASGNLKRDLSK